MVRLNSEASGGCLPWHTLTVELNKKEFAMKGEERHSWGTGLVWARRVIALYPIFGGLLFFGIQTIKLIRPEATEREMAHQPLGHFEWGYVWSDTLVPGPALLAGGILLLSRNRAAQRMGRLLTFAGFAVNSYAMICLWVGLAAIGQLTKGPIRWYDSLLTLLGVLGMGCLALMTVNENLGQPADAADQSGQSELRGDDKSVTDHAGG